MEEPSYQVLLEGRAIGPFDRRTIVGMRIRKTLTSDHVLVAADGARLTVADLVRKRPRDPDFQPNRSGSYSVVQATYSASVMEVQGRKGFDLPPFRGEVEARVQSEVLRIAGTLRRGWRWKEDLIKLPLVAVRHARVRGSLVDLWLRAPQVKDFQRITLELFTPQAAGEFVEWFPAATPWPWDEDAPGREALRSLPLVWAAVVGTVVVVATVLLWVLVRSPGR